MGEWTGRHYSETCPCHNRAVNDLLLMGTGEFPEVEFAGLKDPPAQPGQTVRHPLCVSSNKAFYSLFHCIPILQVGMTMGSLAIVSLGVHYCVTEQDNHRTTVTFEYYARSFT